VCSGGSDLECGGTGDVTLSESSLETGSGEVESGTKEDSDFFDTCVYSSDCSSGVVVDRGDRESEISDNGQKSVDNLKPGLGFGVNGSAGENPAVARGAVVSRSGRGAVVSGEPI